MKHFDIIRLNTVDSTNDYCKALILEGKSNIVVLAQEQIKGRGRFGRNWYSPKGGLYMSFLLKVKDIEKAKYLTFSAALSVLHSIPEKTKIKWPNDLYYCDLKIAGILTETIISEENHAIIGIGVNLNQETMPKKIASFATSLKIETAKHYDIDNISQKIIDNFQHYLIRYEVGELDDIRKEIIKNSFMMDKQVMINTINGEITGKVINIDESCNLVIEKEDGKIISVPEGDLRC